MGLQPSVVCTTRYTSQPANKSNAATALLAAMDACAELHMLALFSKACRTSDRVCLVHSSSVIAVPAAVTSAMKSLLNVACSSSSSSSSSSRHTSRPHAHKQLQSLAGSRKPHRAILKCDCAAAGAARATARYCFWREIGPHLHAVLRQHQERLPDCLQKLLLVFICSQQLLYNQLTS